MFDTNKFEIMNGFLFRSIVCGWKKERLLN